LLTRPDTLGGLERSGHVGRFREALCASRHHID
jgi:hypothetical protein